MPTDDALRDRLVRVGAELLRTGSPGELSLREIARHAGVSHGAPRRHFPTHLDLLSAIAAEGYTDLTRRITAIPGVATPTSPPHDDPRAARAVIHALGREYLAFAAGNRGMF